MNTLKTIGMGLCLILLIVGVITFGFGLFKIATVGLRVGMLTCLAGWVMVGVGGTGMWMAGDNDTEDLKTFLTLLFAMWFITGTVICGVGLFKVFTENLFLGFGIFFVGWVIAMIGCFSAFGIDEDVECRYEPRPSGSCRFFGIGIVIK